MKALSTSNAWFDAQIQEKANLDFALNNPYRPLINESLYDELLEKYKTDIVPSLEECDDSGTSEDCFAAYLSYLDDIEQPIWTTVMDTYDDWIMADIHPGGVRPPTYHQRYLERADVQKAIGVRVNYTESGGQFGILESGDGKSIHIRKEALC